MHSADYSAFWLKVAKGDGCWEWTASRFPNGYGQFQRDGRNHLAHRLAFELTRGPIPDGLVIDHLCRNRACVNPDHLEPVSHRENDLRGYGASGNNARKTECPQGHPLAGANVYVTPSGSRQCRECRRRHARRMDAIRKARRAQPGG